MHNGMVELGEEKMAKSVGNIRLLHGALDEFGRDALVMYFVSGHYRRPLAFSEEALEDARRSVERIRDLVRRLDPSAPEPEEMYPPGFQTWVGVEELSRQLEGASRPGHFRGVATVCLKLFNIINPRRAYFGQKDAQQVAVVKRMVRDLDLDLEIRVLPTVREEDGLALSSRNAYLSAEERAAAAVLPRALATKDPERARALLNGLEIDYVEVADFEPRVLAAAVRIGTTRLIDNIVLEEGAHA